MISAGKAVGDEESSQAVHCPTVTLFDRLHPYKDNKNKYCYRTPSECIPM